MKTNQAGFWVKPMEVDTELVEVGHPFEYGKIDDDKYKELLAENDVQVIEVENVEQLQDLLKSDPKSIVNKVILVAGDQLDFACTTRDIQNDYFRKMTELKDEMIPYHMSPTVFDLNYGTAIPKKYKGLKAVEVRDSKTNPKIQRNQPCSCGSNKKYKYCCINKK